MADNKLQEVLNSLEFHPLKDATVAAKFEDLREAAKAFAQVVDAETPASREQSLAYTHIEEALMWAIKSIAIRN